MTSDLIPVNFSKIMQSRAYTVIILGNEGKKFAIYTEAHVGQTIQTYLTQEQKPRPITYDLIHSIFQGLDIKILQVVIQDIEDTVYFARLFLEQTKGAEKHILEIDVRPSDCIPLALIYKIPLFCRKDVFDKVIPVQE